MIGAIVGDYFGGSQGRSASRSGLGSALPLRRCLGRDRGRQPARDRFLRARRAGRALRAGWRSRRRGAADEIGDTGKGAGMQRRRWFWLVAGSRWRWPRRRRLRRRRRRGSDGGTPPAGGCKDKVTVAAQVGDAGAVRRLLRREGAGLLRRREPRRRRSSRAAPTSRPSRSSPAGRPSSGIDWLASLLAVRDQGDDLVNIAQVFTPSGMTELTWKDSGITTITRPEGEEGRRLALRQRVQAFAALTKNGLDPQNGRQRRRAAVRYEPVPATTRSTPPRP